MRKTSITSLALLLTACVPWSQEYWEPALPPSQVVPYDCMGSRPYAAALRTGPLRTTMFLIDDVLYLHFSMADERTLGFDTTAVRIISNGTAVSLKALSYRTGRALNAPTTRVTGPVDFRGKDISFTVRVDGPLASPVTVELPTVQLDGEVIRLPPVEFSRQRHLEMVPLTGNC